MDRKIRLISTDFDGTLVAHDNDPVLDPGCIELIGQLQRDGALWTINTGRSVELLESGLLDFEFPIRPDFILTSERDVFRPSRNGGKWEPFGDWNDRCAQAHADLFNSAQSVLTEIIDFVNRNTKATRDLSRRCSRRRGCNERGRNGSHHGIRRAGANQTARI